MARGVYWGFDGIAREAQKLYMGIDTEVPVYGGPAVVTAVTAANLSDFFTVSNGMHHFSGTGGTFTSDNAGVPNSVATTTLTAKVDMTVAFTYSYSSEASCDKFTLTVAGVTVENGVSGGYTVKRYSGRLEVGQSIVFTYSKDGSINRGNDKCEFYNLSVTAAARTGTERKPVARKVRAAYIGVNGVARRFFCGHAFSRKLTVSPRCEDDGAATFTCSVCADTYTEAVSALGHSYSTQVISPTCTSGGYTRHVCSRCNTSYNDNYTSALGHSYGSWQQTKAPSCTETGSEKRVCTRNSSHVQTQDIPALGHDYDTTVVEPTCGDDGYTLHVCSRCGDAYRDNSTPATGKHDWEEQIVGGHRVFICTVCGASL